MRSVSTHSQLGIAETLRPRPSRNRRMADRLELTASAAERDAAAHRCSGDWVGAAEARERAQAARRAAQILRAGPGGVRKAFGERSAA